MIGRTRADGPVLWRISGSFALAMFGRVFVGVGVGLGLAIDPLYISELSPPEVNGLIEARVEGGKVAKGL